MNRCLVPVLVLLCAGCASTTTTRPVDAGHATPPTTETVQIQAPIIAPSGPAAVQLPASPLDPPSASGRSGADQARIALGASEAMDSRLASLATLPPVERLAQQRAMGEELMELTEACIGTRHENKAWYLLAQWRFHFNRQHGVDEALDQLERCRSSALKLSGRYLRVQLLARQGRVQRARNEAELLIAQVPEFAPLLDEVTLFARVGATMASVAVEDAAGAVITLPDGDGWRFLAVAEALDGDGLGMLTRAAPLVAAGIAVTVIIEDASPGALREAAVPGVRLVRVPDRAALERLRAAWSTPAGSASLLLDPQSRLATAMIAPEDVPAFRAR